MTRVAMGGTFDVFHKGHRVLLETAFRDGDEFVQVGVTSDTLANSSRDRRVRSQDERLASVREFLDARGWSARGRVVSIDHAFGFALEPEWDTIVVTPETMPNAERINAARTDRGHPPLAVRVAPLVLADDGRPVRATRVVRGEVSPEGELLRPPVVAVGSENPVKVEAVRRAFQKLWPKAEVRGAPVASGVPDQPVGEADTWRGARARAEAALAAVAGADFGVGVEAGLVPREHAGTHLDVQVCCVVDAGGRATWGEGPGFAYPPNVVRRVLEDGETIGDVLGEMSGDPAIGRTQGAIGWLSRGLVDRTTLTEAAIHMALVPRARAAEYGIDRARHAP